MINLYLIIYIFTLMFTETTYTTNRGGFLIFAYFTMSLSGSMFAQEYLLVPKSLLKITMDLPNAEIDPPRGKF